MKIIPRNFYLEKIKSLRGTPDIKVITGLRRSGKSELLKSYVTYLEEYDKNINLIFIDYFDLAFDEIKNYKSLYNYVESKYIKDKDNILMIDEVQLCSGFELAVNSFQNSKKYDIYITGSNAFLLSSDLATLFTGRFIEIHVFPFSYSEFCEYYDLDGTSESSLERYLTSGGLAGSYLYNTKSESENYIKNVYETVVKRDLVDKYKINAVSVLDSLTNFLMDNISNLTTINNIANSFSSSKVEISHVTVANYIKYLCNSFMFYKVKRYDIKGKKYLETSDKYYLSDMGFRFSILGTRNMDYGRAYENIVAIELLRRGYNIYVGKLYEKEVDFVAFLNGKKIYIQVSDNISENATLSRELAPLKSIPDSYPKYLLANTKHPTYDNDGIQIIDISRWLSGKENF